MRKIARIGRGKHQKARKQEIRREQNSNPLQRHSHAHFREMIYFASSFLRYVVANPSSLSHCNACLNVECLSFVMISPNSGHIHSSSMYV